jgi:hypothetical protein
MDQHGKLASGDPPTTGGPGDGMEPRIAKLEASVEHIQSDISEIKSDLRKAVEKVDGGKDAVNSAMIWALLLYFGLAAGLLYALARGFKWL